LAKKYHPDKTQEYLEYFTHVNKAYETLINDHQRAIYDEESMTDEEFFTISFGPVKVNMFTLFLLLAASCVGFWGLKVYKKMKSTKENCPID